MYKKIHSVSLYLLKMFTLLNFLVRGITLEVLKGINLNCTQRQRTLSESALFKDINSVLPYFTIPPPFTLSVYVYMNQELFKLFSSNYTQ